MKVENLQPNCSEMTFVVRDTGKSESGKTKLQQVLEAIADDMEEYDRNRSPSEQKEFKEYMERRKQVARRLREDSRFWGEDTRIVIRETCNYDTVIAQVEKDIWIATCNNEDWRNLQRIAEEVSGQTSKNVERALLRDPYTVIL